VPVRINGLEQVGVEAVTGSTNSVDAPAEHGYWRFVAWADGGPRLREVTMPARDLSLTARYRTAIDARYAALGGASSFLGAPTGSEYDISGGRARDFRGGRLYWSSEGGARYVVGAILGVYLETGGPARWGTPTSDEFDLAGGRASYFTRARIYWTRATGAHVVTGGILAKYLAHGGPAAFGFPETDERVTADGAGRFNHFTGGRSIYWMAATGAHSIGGAIRTRWFNLGAERGRLRYPVTDETATSFGTVSRFQGGRIEWYRASGELRVIYG
jgi:uncharacterized protein with LGFP repeats